MSTDSLEKKICSYAIEQLKKKPLIFLSNFGEMIKKEFSDEQSIRNVKIKSVLSECPDIDILIDNKKQARIAFCKKDDIDTKDMFFKKENLLEEDDFHNITKSILGAFTQSIEKDMHIFIEKKRPFKFKKTSHLEESELDSYIEVEDSLLVQKNGCFNSLSDSDKSTVIKNIKEWCRNNSINFDETMAANKRNKSEKYIQNIDILVNFIKLQPDVVRNKMLFPANILLRILDKN